MPWAEGDGIRLYVERAGDGPRLLYISGTGADLRVRPNGFDQPFAASFDRWACPNGVPTRYDLKGRALYTAGRGPRPSRRGR